MYKLLDTSGVEWYTLEGGRMITRVQTMVVVGNKYIYDKYMCGR